MFGSLLIGPSSIEEVTEVTPYLYVCGQMAINDAVIKQLGITVIVNAAQELNNYVASSERGMEYIEDRELTFVKIPVRDAAESHLYPYFEVSIRYLQIWLG